MPGQGSVKWKISVFTFLVLKTVRQIAHGSNSSQVLIYVYEQHYMNRKIILSRVMFMGQVTNGHLE